MAEYIEREALIESLQKMESELEFADCKDEYLFAWGTLTGVRKSTIYTKSAPNADVVEVRHGVWCLVEYEYLVCNKCGYSYYTGCESTAEAKERLQNGEVPNYCPHCGAKMDGKGEPE